MARSVARWNQDLAQRTGGALSVRVYYGGAMGDEETMVRRMRTGQLDAASLTSTGLSLIHRPVLVMQVPGVFSTYAQVDAVRAAIGPDMERAFEAQGFALIGWGDSGRVRLFSRAPVRRPRDLARLRPWVPRSDAIFREVLAAAGANGIPMGVGEVFAALRTNAIDVVPATAIAVTALQWFTALDHVTAQSDGFLVGGMVVRRGFLDSRPREHREALFASARENQERFLRGVRETDDRAYAALLRRGMTEVDVEAHRAEWERVGAEARRRLAGRIYPAALLERVERIAREAARGARSRAARMRRLAVASEPSHASATSGSDQPSITCSAHATRSFAGTSRSAASISASCARTSAGTLGLASRSSVASSSPRSSPSARKSARLRSLARTMFTAIRITQREKSAGSRSVPSCRRARTKVSCTTSSASAVRPSTRVATSVTGRTCLR